MNWCGYDWITEERWGKIHPEKLDWWYDASAVTVDQNGWLHLGTHKNLQKISLESGEEVESPIGAGLVSCTSRDFHWGTYEIEAKLPAGKCLWPAFWMWSWNTWPPEIDIMEGYSNEAGSYFRWNPLGFWNAQTNIHFSDTVTGKNKSIGGKARPFTFKNPAEEFINYRLVWKPTAIYFYYNNRLVRKVTDRNILEQVNATEMNVIINNGVTRYLPDHDQTSDFIVKYFKYTPRNL
jgi:beta-glucanase (GH16 family)